MTGISGLGIVLLFLGIVCLLVGAMPNSTKAQLPIAQSYSQGDMDLAVRDGVILGQQNIMQYQDIKRQAEHIAAGKKQEAELNDKFHVGLQLSWEKGDAQ